MRLGLLLCLALALPAHADDLLDGILRRLAEPAVIRAQFVQERTVPEMARPTVSRGRLTVSREAGVLWRVDSPVQLSLAFTPSQIIETGPDGVRRLRSQGRGIETQIGRVMRGILGADAASLRQGFEASAQGSAERWQIRLQPRPREMARVLREIRLAGGRHLESIEIEETSGNQTAIRMHGFAPAQGLDAEEAALFRAP